MLYVVPTPIGNLRDITLRALDVLRGVHAVICEDTRHTQKLLKAHEIEKPLLSFHEHSGPGRVRGLVARLEEGEDLALVSDAGMPLINDPGFDLLREARRLGIKVEVLPGASSVITALAGSGLATDAFSFHGFLPNKSAARRKVLQGLEAREETLIFFESPHRVPQALGDMQAVLGDREAVVARELTKKFEEYARGPLSELAEKFSAKALGEFVILVSGKDRKKVLSI